MGRSKYRYFAGSSPIPGYELVEMLGRGNAGEVWKASFRGAHRAIKFSLLESALGERERKALRLLTVANHPSLVTIFDWWLRDDRGRIISSDLESSLNEAPPSGKTLGGRPPTDVDEAYELVYAMNLCDCNLFDRLKSCKADGLDGIPHTDLLRYLERAAEALDHLNTRGIQHCDVKPTNIMLVAGVAQVGDFGLARMAAGGTMTTSVAFTPDYVAPEIVRGDNISAFTDQYSLAITYVHLRTGELPFEEKTDNVLKIQEYHRTGRLDLTRLSERERAVIRRATDLRPEDRWESCSAMVEQLRQACSGIAEILPVPKLAWPPKPGQDLGKGYKLRRSLSGVKGHLWEASSQTRGSVLLSVHEFPDDAPDGAALALVKALRHPHIDPPQDFWYLDATGRPLEVGEEAAVPGEAARTVIARLGARTTVLDRTRRRPHPDPLREHLQILEHLGQVAEALDHLHAQTLQAGGRTVSIQHLAVRPESFVLVNDKVKLSCFDFCRTLEGDAGPLGGPLRSPPECTAQELLEGKITRRTDQCGLALSYVRLRSGRWPFDAGVTAETIWNLRKKNRWNQVLPGKEEWKCILRATDPDPGKRFGSCVELIETLRRCDAPPIERPREDSRVVTSIEPSREDSQAAPSIESPRDEARAAPTIEPRPRPPSDVAPAAPGEAPAELAGGESQQVPRERHHAQAGHTTFYINPPPAPRKPVPPPRQLLPGSLPTAPTTGDKTSKSGPQQRQRNPSPPPSPPAAPPAQPAQRQSPPVAPPSPPVSQRHSPPVAAEPAHDPRPTGTQPPYVPVPPAQSRWKQIARWVLAAVLLVGGFQAYRWWDLSTKVSNEIARRNFDGALGAVANEATGVLKWKRHGYQQQVLQAWVAELERLLAAREYAEAADASSEVLKEWDDLVDEDPALQEWDDRGRAAWKAHGDSLIAGERDADRLFDYWKRWADGVPDVPVADRNEFGAKLIETLAFAGPGADGDRALTAAVAVWQKWPTAVPEVTAAQLDESARELLAALIASVSRDEDSAAIRRAVDFWKIWPAAVPDPPEGELPAGDDVARLGEQLVAAGQALADARVAAGDYPAARACFAALRPVYDRLGTSAPDVDQILYAKALQSAAGAIEALRAKRTLETLAAAVDACSAAGAFRAELGTGDSPYIPTEEEQEKVAAFGETLLEAWLAPPALADAQRLTGIERVLRAFPQDARCDDALVAYGETLPDLECVALADGILESLARPSSPTDDTAETLPRLSLLRAERAGALVAAANERLRAAPPDYQEAVSDARALWKALGPESDSDAALRPAIVELVAIIRDRWIEAGHALREEGQYDAARRTGQDILAALADLEPGLGDPQLAVRRAQRLVDLAQVQQDVRAVNDALQRNDSRAIYREEVGRVAAYRDVHSAAGAEPPASVDAESHAVLADVLLLLARVYVRENKLPQAADMLDEERQLSDRAPGDDTAATEPAQPGADRRQVRTLRMALQAVSGYQRLSAQDEAPSDEDWLAVADELIGCRQAGGSNPATLDASDPAAQWELHDWEREKLNEIGRPNGPVVRAALAAVAAGDLPPERAQRFKEAFGSNFDTLLADAQRAFDAQRYVDCRRLLSSIPQDMLAIDDARRQVIWLRVQLELADPQTRSDDRRAALQDASAQWTGFDDQRQRELSGLVLDAAERPAGGLELESAIEFMRAVADAAPQAVTAGDLGRMAQLLQAQVGALHGDAVLDKDLAASTPSFSASNARAAIGWLDAAGPLFGPAAVMPHALQADWAVALFAADQKPTAARLADRLLDDAGLAPELRPGLLAIYAAGPAPSDKAGRAKAIGRYAEWHFAVLKQVPPPAAQVRYDRLLDPAAKLAAESLQKKDALGQDEVRAAAELSAEACRLLADGAARPAGAQKPAETRYKLADQAVQLGEQAFPDAQASSQEARLLSSYYVLSGEARWALRQESPRDARSELPLVVADGKRASELDPQAHAARYLHGRALLQASRAADDTADRLKQVSLAASELELARDRIELAIEGAGADEQQKRLLQKTAVDCLVSLSAAKTDEGNFTPAENVQSRRGCFELARDSAVLALELGPAVDVPASTLGQAQRALGNALEDLAWLIGNEDARLLRNYEGALQAFSKAIDQLTGREQAQAYCDRGRCRFKRVHDSNQADSSYPAAAERDLTLAVQTALTADAELPEAQLWRAQVYADWWLRSQKSTQYRPVPPSDALTRAKNDADFALQRGASGYAENLAYFAGLLEKDAAELLRKPQATNQELSEAVNLLAVVSRLHPDKDRQTLALVEGAKGLERVDNFRSALDWMIKAVSKRSDAENSWQARLYAADLAMKFLRAHLSAGGRASDAAFRSVYDSAQNVLRGASESDRNREQMKTAQSALDRFNPAQAPN
jgi:serine/threonine protein kinase